MVDVLESGGGQLWRPTAAKQTDELQLSVENAQALPANRC